MWVSRVSDSDRLGALSMLELLLHGLHFFMGG